MRAFLTGVSLLQLTVLFLYGAAGGECSSLSCTMELHPLALALGAQALALQAALGWFLRPSLQLPVAAAAVDAGLALATGLASYGVAGAWHNYVALALFVVRVAVGIRVARATEWRALHVGALQGARLASIAYLHTYGCARVLPGVCAYAALGRLPARVELTTQFLFVTCGVTSVLFTSHAAPATRAQAVFFGGTALASVVAAGYGIAGGHWSGGALFGLGGAFDAHVAWHVWRARPDGAPLSGGASVAGRASSLPQPPRPPRIRGALPSFGD